MKCSDCKYYKTNECTVNPEGKDCGSAETFGCFKFSGDNDDINQAVPKPIGRRWRIIGGIIFWVGIAGVIVSFIVFFHDTGETAIEDYIEPLIYGAFGFLVSLFIVFLGAMIWFAQRREEERYLNSGSIIKKKSRL